MAESNVKQEKAAAPKIDWYLRTGTPEDEKSIKQLLVMDMFKGRDIEALYRWKYRDNPQGAGYFEVGANSQQETIAVGCFMPWRFCHHGEFLGAAQLVDAYTHPDYRRQGIVQKQFNRALAWFYAQKAPIGFAFPNDSMVPGHKKNNAHLVGSIQRYTRPLRTGYLVQRRVKWSPLARPLAALGDLALSLTSKEHRIRPRSEERIERVSQCGSEFDAFWEEYRMNHPERLMSHKTAAYLNWKYVHSPNPNRTLHALRRGGAVAGFVALETTSGGIGYLVDIVAADHEAFEQLIAYALRLFHAADMESAVFVALQNHPSLDALKDFRFIQRPEENLFFIYLDDNLPDKAQYLDPNTWCITIGDCDVAAL